MSRKTRAGLTIRSHAPSTAPAALVIDRARTRGRCPSSSARYPIEPPRYPGSTATALVTFAVTLPYPAASSAGKEIRDPPPATAFTAPAASPAAASSASWPGPRCTAATGATAGTLPARAGFRRAPGRRRPDAAPVEQAVVEPALDEGARLPRAGVRVVAHGNTLEARRVDAGQPPMIAERLTAQLLAGPPARGPVSVAERLLAVQGQDPRGARLAVRARTAGLSALDVDRALTDDRSLLITWGNRGTLHLIRREDYPRLHALTTPPLFTSSARRLGQEGVSPDAADRGAAVIERSLTDDAPLTRAQLKERLGGAEL